MAERPRSRGTDVLWKVPFVLASTVMVGAGVGQALGRTGVPPVAAVAALALALVGTLTGLIALRLDPLPRPLTEKDSS